MLVFLTRQLNADAVHVRVVREAVGEFPCGGRCQAGKVKAGARRGQPPPLVDCSHCGGRGTVTTHRTLLGGFTATLDEVGAIRGTGFEVQEEPA